MDRSPAAALAMPSAARPDEILFHDGFGDRLLVRDEHGRPLHEALALRAELTAIPSFEFALNQQLTRLDRFEHSAFVPVRRVVRVPGALPRLSLIADYSGGVRLSETLARLESDGRVLPTGAALFILKEILDAIAVLHKESGEISHGAIAPERIVSVDGRIRIAEYALGGAVEQLRFSSERYWKDLRVAVPRSAGGARFDRRVDVAQIGMVALALFAGRPLRDSEHMGSLGEVLMGLRQTRDGRHSPLSSALRSWLVKTLHMDHRRVFVNALEASESLDDAMAEAGLRPTAPELASFAVQSPRRVPTTFSPKPAIGQKPAPPSKPVVAPKTAAVAAPQKAHSVVNRPPMETIYEAPTSNSYLPDWVGPRVRMLLMVGLIGVLMAGAFSAAQFIPAPATLFTTTGTLVVESKPQGVELFVDGKPMGSTPLTLKLESGRHEVELRRNGTARVFTVAISRGARVSQYIEFPTTRPRR